MEQSPRQVATIEDWSETCWIRFRQFAFFPPAGPLQRFDRAGFIKMNHGVELLRHAGVEIMAPAFGVGPIDHADGPLQPLWFELLAHLSVSANGQQEFGY